MLQHQITSDSNILYKYLTQIVQFYFCVLSQTAKRTLVPWIFLQTPPYLMPLRLQAILQSLQTFTRINEHRADIAIS